MKLSLYRRRDGAIVVVPEMFLPSFAVDPRGELLFLGSTIVDDALVGKGMCSTLEQQCFAVMPNGGKGGWLESCLQAIPTAMSPLAQAARSVIGPIAGLENTGGRRSRLPVLTA